MSMKNSTTDPQKIKKAQLPYDPAILLLGVYPKEFKARSPKHVCTPMFIAALLAIAKKCGKPSCQSSGIIIRLKRKEILLHAATGMSLESIMLSEITLLLKEKYYMSLPM